MKIILDSRLLLPKMTGIGRYLLGLIQEMGKIEDGFEIEIWLQNNLPESHPVWALGNERIAFRQLSINHMVVNQQWVIPWELSKTSFDLFHYPHFDLPFFSPGPILLTLYDLKYISRPEFFPNFSATKRLLMWLMMLFAVRKAKIVITLSRNSREDIIRYLKVDPSKLVIIPAGVDENYFIPKSNHEISEVLEKYGISPPYLLSVGELRPHKNYIGLVKAYDHYIKKSSRHCQLVITGKGYSTYDEPKRLVQKLGLSKDVHFIYVDDEDLPTLYQAAEVYITLSLYEGFGLPVLEAMASGTPVVAANLTSLPEIVGKAGVLVNPEDYDDIANSLAQVSSGGDHRGAIIQMGIERAKEFSWRNCALKTFEVYKRIVN